jgi:hypothetical protein
LPDYVLWELLLLSPQRQPARSEAIFLQLELLLRQAPPVELRLLDWYLSEQSASKAILLEAPGQE